MVFSADITIDQITCTNNSLGSYEYWGQFGVDKRPDHIDNFEIESIYINDIKLISKKYINELKENLLNDINFIKKIQEQLQYI